tara:strand:- start:201 stop:677 length:477 start_codon:yes stop_codon:yes gene_type:complete
MKLQALKRLARSRKNWNPRTVDKLYDLYRKSAFGALAGGLPAQKFAGGELVSLTQYRPATQEEEEQFMTILQFHETRPLYWIVHENLNGNHAPLYAPVDPNNSESRSVWWYEVYPSTQSIDPNAVPDEEFCILVPEPSLKLQRASPTPPASPRMRLFD